MCEVIALVCRLAVNIGLHYTRSYSRTTEIIFINTAKSNNDNDDYDNNKSVSMH